MRKLYLAVATFLAITFGTGMVAYAADPPKCYSAKQIKDEAAKAMLSLYKTFEGEPALAILNYIKSHDPGFKAFDRVDFYVAVTSPDGSGYAVMYLNGCVVNVLPADLAGITDLLEKVFKDARTS